jgi:hypothetical protein
MGDAKGLERRRVTSRAAQTSIVITVQRLVSSILRMICSRQYSSIGPLLRSTQKPVGDPPLSPVTLCLGVKQPPGGTTGDGVTISESVLWQSIDQQQSSQRSIIRYSCRIRSASEGFLSSRGQWPKRVGRNTANESKETVFGTVKNKKHRGCSSSLNTLHTTTRS